MTKKLSSNNKRYLRDQQQHCIPQVFRVTRILNMWITCMLCKGPREGSADHLIFFILIVVYLHEEVV